MGRANVALDEGCDRAARLLDVRDDGVRLVVCVLADLRDIGAPQDVILRLQRALDLIDRSETALKAQRKRNRKLERKA